jgi:hypothetical protein
MANALVVHKDRLPQSQKILRAAQYVRMSTDLLQYSIENQAVVIAAYAQVHNPRLSRVRRRARADAFPLHKHGKDQPHRLRGPSERPHKVVGPPLPAALLFGLGPTAPHFSGCTSGARGLRSMIGSSNWDLRSAALSKRAAEILGSVVALANPNRIAA